MTGKQVKKIKQYKKTPRGATAPCWKLAVIDPEDEGSYIIYILIILHYQRNKNRPIQN